MAFELQVVSHAPLTGETDPQRLAKQLFAQIGYTARKGPDHGISFKLFYDCFLLHPTKEWTVEQLAHTCGTTMPSIYRHLNKLKDYDLVEDVYIGGEGEDGEGSDRRRAFRLRYGDFAKAWNFAEAHFHLAIENYRKSVDHLEALLKAARSEHPAPPAATAAPPKPASPAVSEPVVSKAERMRQALRGS
ncbi:MAG: helix-turn-helix domain-containing protein [bacterium]